MRLSSLHNQPINEVQVGSSGKIYRQGEIYDMLDQYLEQTDIYGTYVDIPMLKLNYGYEEGDPIAVYAYPVKQLKSMRGETHWGYGDRQFLILFRAPNIDGPGVLHFRRSGTRLLKRARTALLTMGATMEWVQATLLPYEREFLSLVSVDPHTYPQRRADIVGEAINDDAYIWNMAEGYVTNGRPGTRESTIFTTKLYRAMGAWAAIDHGTGTMGEPHQGAFMDQTRLKS